MFNPLVASFSKICLARCTFEGGADAFIVTDRHGSAPFHTKFVRSSHSAAVFRFRQFR